MAVQNIRVPHIDNLHFFPTTIFALESFTQSDKIKIYLCT